MTTTNRLALLIAALGILTLTACSKDEPASAETAPAEVEQDVADTATDETAGEPIEEAVEEALEVVEESAAEPEESDEAPIVLAQADSTPPPPVSSQFKEGQHYIRLVPTQPTFGGSDKVEVVEFFWYGCPHCFDLEPTINRWAENVPANVRFVRAPAMWNDVLKVHAQLFYTAQVLGQNGKIRDPEGFRRHVFEEFHLRNNRLLSEQSILRAFERFGVTETDFRKTWSSFEVAQKMRVAEDLARRYSISGVPAVVVNGKFRTGGAEAGSYPRMLEVVDELVARESAR